MSESNMCNAVPSMDSAAMEAAMSDRAPLHNISWVKTGDAGMDLIGLVLSYCRDTGIRTELAIRALQYAMDSIKLQSTDKEYPRGDSLAKLRSMMQQGIMATPPGASALFGGMGNPGPQAPQGTVRDDKYYDLLKKALEQP